MKVRLWKVILGIFVLVLLVGGGMMLYREGYTHGVMSDMSFEAMPFAESGLEQMSPYYGMPYGMYGYRGHMGFFSPARFLFGGLIFFLFFGAIFRFFGMRRYMMIHRMGYDGKGGPPWMRHHHPCRDEMPREGDEEEKAEDENDEA
mgnify:CR=1 FL=1